MNKLGDSAIHKEEFEEEYLKDRGESSSSLNLHQYNILD
jgi:hypothetical protein